MIASEVRILHLIVSKRLELWPFIYSHVQPSSIDLTLVSIIKIPKDGVTVDPGAEVTDDNYELLSIKCARYALRPGDLVL